MADWVEASAQCDTIVELIDEEITEETYLKADEFFDGVKETVISIQETIDTQERCSTKQKQALDNMEEKVRKWLHDD